MVKGSKSLNSIIQKLKSMESLSPVKFDDKANAAVRANNQEIYAREEAEPAAGGNLDKLREQDPNMTSKGAEASYFNYAGSSAEEFVALLLFQDFEKKLESTAAQKKEDEPDKKKEEEVDKAAAEGAEILKVAEGDASKQEENSMVHEKVPEPEPEYDSPILYEKTVRVGISNKSHTKVLNSIQIIYVFEIVTAMA